MHFTSLRVERFRNLQHTEVQLAPGFHVIEGENGQGKTNFLDALSFVSTLRSFRALNARDLLAHGEDQASISARVEVRGLPLDMAVEIHPRGRRVYLQGKVLRSVQGYFGSLNTVVFIPEDISVFRSGPAERRLFFDRMLFQARPAWAEEAARYEEALKRRNALLKRETLPLDQLNVFDRQLARYALVLMRERARWIEEIGPPLHDNFRSIFGEEVTVALRYMPSLPWSEDVDEDALFGEYVQGRRKDHVLGYTSIGPQRDDIGAFLQGEPFRVRASQGQHRALVLALKITEMQKLSECLGQWPVFLLDDVSSELDPQRNQRLFHFLATMEGQVFLTTTNAASLPLPSEVHRWQMAGGVLSARRS